MTQFAKENPKSRQAGARALLEGIGRWASDFCRRVAARAEIAGLDRMGGLDALFADLGISRWEVNRMARGYPEAERLLPDMAHRQGIALDRLDARSLYDLRHTCAICDAHHACRRWLAAGGNGEVDFCPNAMLFAALRRVDTQATALSSS